MQGEIDTSYSHAWTVRNRERLHSPGYFSVGQSRTTGHQDLWKLLADSEPEPGLQLLPSVGDVLIPPAVVELAVVAAAVVALLAVASTTSSTCR